MKMTQKPKALSTYFRIIVTDEFQYVMDRNVQDQRARIKPVYDRLRLGLVVEIAAQVPKWLE